MLPLFILEGIVAKGKSRGKSLGFPTANISADTLLPKGTYISRTEIKGKTYPSITFIGTVDTFNETNFVAETYILNFDEDIYGKKIKVEILKKLRDNRKFESVEKLVAQMKQDEKKAIEFFDNFKT